MRANVGFFLFYLTIGYQFKMAARQVLSMMPPVQNRKPRVFRAIELRANLLEIEVSEVDGISNKIKFLLVKPSHSNYPAIEWVRSSR
jgi:hypothetical protein